MPIYEYECPKCGHQAEILQRISDKPLAKCELCKGRMKKLISQSTFHLKGTGWYVTDYAAKKTGSEPVKEKTADSSSETTKADKTESVAEKPKKAASSESAKKD
ncbi:MAG: FmdB family zinc ribbon protein [Pseudomonadota bacterium]